LRTVEPKAIASPDGRYDYSGGSACNKMQVSMMEIFYTADDYVGKDSIDLDGFFPNGNARKVTFNIVVKK
jgi:hypothetical protein